MKTSKWITLSLVFIVLISMLGACSSGNSGAGGNKTEGGQTAGTDKPSAPVKLMMWGGVPPESGPQAVVDAWNKEHPEIQVEYVRFVNDDDGNLKLDTALLTGQNVDLFVNYTLTQTQKRIDAGVALDLSAFTDYNILEKMGSNAEGWQVNGKFYGVPTTRSAFFVALNKDALDAAGLPVPKDWTWEQAREYAKTLKPASGYGMVQHLEPFLDPIDAALTKEGYVKADGTSNLDSPSVKKWLETLGGMMTLDQTTPPLGEQITSKIPVENVFLAGESPMLNIGAWLLRSSNNFTDFPRDFKIAFAPVPRLVENQADYIPRGGLGDYISINAKSSYTKEAWEFLKWYADGGMAPMAAGGRLPASNAADQDEMVANLLGDKGDTYDKESLMYVLFEDETPTHVRELPQEVTDLITQEYEKFFLGNQNADQTTANMVKRHNEYLKQAK
ncbi:ABC transporter substrate-binding protein [Paenibacillus luteus]|uniref:ABC transporter substrate-binding protein n=1 Tax=Paenibacillus luteus TaxID=2545753 RepID=UPI001F4F7C15|nr:extracellular solute-binding protein [Paenibacillus luteus]